MDFLDPKKQKAYKVRLIIGYCLVAIALVLTTIVLLYQAYGFGLDKNGKIIQSGLVFVSSTPSPAQIYINDARYKNDTNVRIPLPSGQYTLQLKRTGYNTWKRAISVDGGSVTHYDYPFLFPTKIQTSEVKGYSATVDLATQSPDRHWALVQTNASINHFDVYDLTQPKQVQNAKDLTLPDSVLTATQSGTSQSWQLVQWSNDNRHVVLKHVFTKDNQQTYEYVLVDRTDPTQSVNLTQVWGTNPSAVELRNQKYDEYYLYDQAAQTLSTSTLKTNSVAPQLYLDHILAYRSYGNNIILYASNKSMTDGKANVVWQDGNSEHILRTVGVNSDSTKYMLDLAQYSGDWFVIVNDPSDNKVYVYKNPLDAVNNKQVLVPVHILKAANVNYLDFSDNARFIMAESGNQFAVYDAENDKGYVYANAAPMDAPQVHAVWMDGHRITYTSKGKAVVFDFDSANQATLNVEDSNFLPMFSADYKYLYSIGVSTDAQKPAVLNQTALRTPQDL